MAEVADMADVTSPKAIANSQQEHATSNVPETNAGLPSRPQRSDGRDALSVGPDLMQGEPARPPERVSADQARVPERLDSIDRRLEKLEALLNQLVQQRAVKDWYTTAEAAPLLGRAEFTVREWCRLGRVHARKRACGRGQSQEWIISHQELQRIRNEGLLPQPRTSTRIT
jgi:hypothetical protein